MISCRGRAVALGMAAALAFTACANSGTAARPATRTRPRQRATRAEAIASVNESCRRFVEGDGKLDHATQTADARRAVAGGRLELVRTAERRLDATAFPSAMSTLRDRVGLQLRQAEALYDQALATEDPSPMLRQAQTLLAQIASELYEAGAQDCVPDAPSVPATPPPANAGRLLPRPPIATITVGPLGADDNRIVASDDMVWVGLKNTREMVRIDPATNSVVARVDLAAAPSGMPQIVDGFVWISTTDDVVRIDPATNRIDRRVPRTALGPGDRQVVVTSDSILSCNDVSLVTVDALDGHERGRVMLADGCENVTVESGAVWVLGTDEALRRIDTDAGTVVGEPVPAHGGFQSLQNGGSAVWSFGDGGVTRMDASTGRILGTARRDDIDFIEPCYGSGALWIASEPERRVIRVDEQTMEVVELSAGDGANALGCSTGTVWVANSNESTVSRFDVGDLG